MNIKSAADIDRKTAGKILGVSVRTVDRYIRRGRLSFKQENGKIRLNKKEILSFPKEQIGHARLPLEGRRNIPVLSSVAQKAGDASFYRDLYEETKRAMVEYQQRLENANYRIGNLESQIMHPSTPAKMEHQDNSFAAELLRRELSDREKELTLLRDLVKKEKTNRIVFAVLTYALLLTIPLVWYLLRGS